MREAISPRVHLFVCANRREGSPLGPGCAERGDALYDLLKRAVAASGKVADVWVTKTHCLGICPKRGATVARAPGFADTPSADGRLRSVMTEVEPADVPTLLREPAAPPAPPATAKSSSTEELGVDALMREIDLLEELETTKVLALARRLLPGLTLEDIRNPHDFPALDDPDWHYADGVLAGVKAVQMAARALKNRRG